MKRGLIAVAAAVLLLTGCTAQTPEAAVSDVPAGTTASASQTAAPAEDTSTPAAPVEVTATAPPKQDASDVLVGIQLTVAGYDVVVNAEQIKSAADYTCDQIASGVAAESVIALTGDIPAGANADLVQMSADFYCPIR